MYVLVRINIVYYNHFPLYLEYINKVDMRWMKSASGESRLNTVV